ncbi:hypothetical protein ACIOTI_25315 [Streptomyces sp. NPDC087843]|uniref:hypothetical protein n=1 Tax=Streptomyces sp. NPDC087843 TaxID=3365804 RepID=UPI0038135135
MAGTEAGRALDGEQSAGMRLDQIPADTGGSEGPAGLIGGKPDLASSPAEKRAAAKAIEDHIEPDTAKSGRWADEETAAAVKAFDAKDGEGWLTSAALKKAHTTWGEQVKNLMDRLGSEKGALRSTSLVLQTTDLAVGSGLRQSSSLERY